MNNKMNLKLNLKMNNLNLTLLAVCLLSFLFTGCFKRESAVPNIELTQDMMKDPSLKAQEGDPSRPDKRGNMLPPEGTVPQGAWSPYPKFASDVEAKGNPNPVTSNKEILARGNKQFQIYCSVCHGTKGNGAGVFVDRMLVKPPSLLSTKIHDWTDGQIFHLITRGRGMMKGYESQVPSANDRWAIVHYIRYLQKSQTIQEAPPAASGN